MKKYNGYIVALTEDARKRLDEAHALCWSEQLAQTVSTFRAGETGFDVDAFDGISIAGVPLSFLRDNKGMTVTVMTLEEAHTLDRVSKQMG